MGARARKQIKVWLKLHKVYTHVGKDTSLFAVPIVSEEEIDGKAK